MVTLGSSFCCPWPSTPGVIGNLTSCCLLCWLLQGQSAQAYRHLPSAALSATAEALSARIDLIRLMRQQHTAELSIEVKPRSIH